MDGPTGRVRVRLLETGSQRRIENHSAEHSLPVPIFRYFFRGTTTKHVTAYLSVYLSLAGRVNSYDTT